MFERRGRVPSCRGCLRKITIGLVLATCLLFATLAEAQTDCHMHGTERYVDGYYKLSFIFFSRLSIVYLFVFLPQGIGAFLTIFLGGVLVLMGKKLYTPYPSLCLQHQKPAIQIVIPTMGRHIAQMRKERKSLCQQKT